MNSGSPTRRAAGRGLIRGIGFLYGFLAILSMPSLAYWSFAIPSALREPSFETLSVLAFFAIALTISLAAGLAGWGLLALRPWARVVALGLNVLGASPILFSVFSGPRVMLRELVLPGAVLLCLVGISALLLRADFDALRRAD